MFSHSVLNSCSQRVNGIRSTAISTIFNGILVYLGNLQNKVGSHFIDLANKKKHDANPIELKFHIQLYRNEFPNSTALLSKIVRRSSDKARYLGMPMVELFPLTSCDYQASYVDFYLFTLNFISAVAF